MGDYIPLFYMDVITYPCPNFDVSLAILEKGAQGVINIFEGS